MDARPERDAEHSSPQVFTALLRDRAASAPLSRHLGGGIQSGELPANHGLNWTYDIDPSEARYRTSGGDTRSNTTAALVPHSDSEDTKLPRISHSIYEADFIGQIQGYLWITNMLSGLTGLPVSVRVYWDIAI